MEEKTLRAYEPDLQRQWRKDIAEPVRFARTGYEAAVPGVISAWPPTVFMREHLKTTDIVIRLGWSSRQLSKGHRKIYFDTFVPLAQVFESVLSTKAAKQKTRIRVKLARQAYDAYKATWLRLFRTLCLDQFDPQFNPPEWLSKIEKDFCEHRPPGRPPKNEDKRLRNRFKLLFTHCDALYRAISKYKTSKEAEGKTDRVSILKRFRRQILKIPGGLSILGGEAFLQIPYGKQEEPTTLESPATWNSRQLAISLLAFEVSQHYHTVERKLSSVKP